MYSFLMLVGVSAGLWAAFALFLAILPKNRRLKLRHAGVAALVFVGTSLVGAAIGPSRTDYIDASTAGTSPDAKPPAEPKSLVMTDVEKAQRNADYISRLKEAILDMARAPTMPESPKSLGLMAILPAAWVQAYENGAPLSLSQEDEAIRQQFRASIAKWQTANLPKLRDAFGPAMSKELWVEDGEARTTGTGFRTVTFIHRRYAANRNIAEDHKNIEASLIRLRFTRAEYKWFKQASEYTYFEMKPPKDSDLVVWTDGGFRVVK